MWLFILLGIFSPHWTSVTASTHRDQHVTASSAADGTGTLLMKAKYIIDLSGLQITEITKEDFPSSTSPTTLNLSNNLLQEFDLSLVSGMKKLEHLSLSHNRLTHLTGSVLELDNLKVIDISYNKFEVISENQLRYVPKSVQLLVEGNERSFISGNNRLSRSGNDKPMRFHGLKVSGSDYEHAKWGFESSRFMPFITIKSRLLEDTFGECGLEDTLLCMNSDIVESVGISTEYDTNDSCLFFAGSCQSGSVRLRERGIKKFKPQWFHTEELVEIIDLSVNRITEITPEVLNDLPSMIKMVNFTNNPISIIKKNVIDNKSLKSLLLTVEGGSGIENGVFEKTSLDFLSIWSRNDLDVNFIKTLPTSLTKLFIDSCNFVPFTENILSNLKLLEVVSLRGCKLTNLPALFAGLNKLESIDLRHNSIENIEAGTFNDNVDLSEIFLSHNKIKTLPAGLFSAHPKLDQLYVNDNELRKISPTELATEGRTVRIIDFQNNKIGEIEENAFVEVHIWHLDLRGNQIETLGSGAIKGSYLWQLRLENNSLVTIDEGFSSNSRITWLYLDDNPMKTLKKNTLRNVSGVFAPEIENIESGALYRCDYLQVKGERLKSISGGIFKYV